MVKNYCNIKILFNIIKFKGKYINIILSFIKQFYSHIINITTKNAIRQKEYIKIGLYKIANAYCTQFILPFQRLSYGNNELNYGFIFASHLLTVSIGLGLTFTSCSSSTQSSKSYKAFLHLSSFIHLSRAPAHHILAVSSGTTSS